MVPSIALGVLAVASVFAHDAQVGQTARVSVSSRAVQGNANSSSPLLSADGTLVVFQSAASNLVARDRNRRADIFLRERDRGRTRRLIRSASITTPGVNPFYFDGHQLGFATYSDTSHYFVRDLASRATTQLDLDERGRPAQLWLDDAPTVSDGVRHFAFTGFNPKADEAGIQLFVRDRAAATTSLVSVALDGRPGNGESRAAAISADGRYVAFHSSATDLVAGDTNGHEDVFVRDRLTSTTTRVSVGSGGSESNASSTGATISADGQLVAFASDATNLVAGD